MEVGAIPLQNSNSEVEVEVPVSPHPHVVTTDKANTSNNGTVEDPTNPPSSFPKLTHYLLSRKVQKTYCSLKRYSNSLLAFEFECVDLIDYVLSIASNINDDCEPMSFIDVMNSSNVSNRRSAMNDEINTLNKNTSWIIVERPKNVKVLGSIWPFKMKERIKDVEPTRYTARLIAQGFAQRKGIDLNDLFSLVVKFTSIKIWLSLSAQFD